jgi:phosphatidylglycerol:prolipoprotein diacylglycerol transferase
VHPDLIHEPRLPTYALMQLAGFLAAVALALWRARRAAVALRHVLILSALLGVAMPIGARIMGRIVTDAASESFWDIFRVWEPGGATVIFGGFLFGVVVVLEYGLFSRQSAARLADVFAPSLALGLAFGKLGCFFAGCCFGDVCAEPSRLELLDAATRQQVQTFPLLSPPQMPLAVTFPKASMAHAQHVALGLEPIGSQASLPVHPVQLYESALALALCIALLAADRCRKRDGEIFWLFGLGYGAARFLTDFFRASDPPVLAGLTLAQVLSVSLAVICLGAFGMRRRAGRRHTPPPLKK